MKKKSIKINAILNAIRILMTLIFPLITFPYATRVLGTENIGKVQFGNSIVIYFALIAVLGINTYAVREGTRKRENKEEFVKFANEIFSINIVFTIISYLLLFLLIFIPSKISIYRKIILIQSLSIFFTTLGVEWIYSIYEDYAYITIKSIVAQLLSMVLLFLFVKESDDYYIYALISVIANAGVNVFNFFYARKYCKVKFVLNNNFTYHIKALFLLFSNELAIKVYINSDVILLGFFTNDYYVGIYSVAVKIYTIIKSLINALIAVTIPRFSIYSNLEDKNQYNTLSEKVLKACILLIIPAIVGIIILSDEIVLFISEEDFLGASESLKILSIALGFAVLGNFFANTVLVPYKQEKYILKSTVIAAILNVLLNFVFIKYFKHNGAAFTTVIAEFTVMIMLWYYSKKYLKCKRIFKTIFHSFMGCIMIIFVSVLIKKNVANAFGIISYSVILGSVVYFITLLMIKDEFMISLIKEIIGNIKVKFKKI